MKRLLTGLFSGLVLGGIALAQTTAPSGRPTPQGYPSPTTTQSAGPASGQARETPRLAPGSVIPVELTKSVEAKKVKTGDVVAAKVTQDLKTGSGEIVVPKDTQVIGHVTEAQAHNKQKESQVGIVFDQVVMKGGGEMPLPMSIQAIIAPATNNNNYPAGGSAGQPASMPEPGGASPGNMGGRGMGTGMPNPGASYPSGGEYPNATSQTGSSARPPVNADTRGIVGMPHLKLSAAADTSQASVVTEKGDVKLESGTLMLLRVK
jgi:hypothetical protein